MTSPKHSRRTTAMFRTSQVTDRLTLRALARSRSCSESQRAPVFHHEQAVGRGWCFRGATVHRLILSVLVGLLILLARPQGAASSVSGVVIVDSNGAARGWSVDLSETRLSTKVSLYLNAPKGAGGALIGTISATVPRPALNVAPYSYAGDHGFVYFIRSEDIQQYALADGLPHQLYAYGFDLAGQDETLLAGSPVSFTLSTIPPHGAVETFFDGSFSGWALDLDTPSSAITVELYADAIDPQHLMGTVTADQSHPSVGPHGFEFSIPAAFRDYKLHTAFAVAVGNTGETRQLENSGQSRFAFGDGVEVGGVEEAVFDWTKDRCLDLENIPGDPHGDSDIPDMHARAFKDAAGNIQLLSTHHLNLRSIGPNLSSLSHDCTSVLRRSSYDRDPGRYDDHSWMSATYTEDGQTVHAILHNEFRGLHHDLYNLDPDNVLCGDGQDENDCWMSTATYARSTDRGATYNRLITDPISHLVAADPFTYADLMENIEYTRDVLGVRNGRMGVADTSNIIKLGNYFYMMAPVVKFERAGAFPAAAPGACLMRTDDLSDPSSWRAWKQGGSSFDTSFTMSFIDPEANPPAGDPLEDRCDLVANNEIGSMAASITKNKCFRDANNVPRVLLLGRSQRQQANLPVPPAGWDDPNATTRPVHGYYYALSASGSDLSSWEGRRIIMEALFSLQSPSDFPLPWDADAPDTFTYVSLIDHGDNSRNFEKSDEHGYIYFTRLHHGKWGVSSGVSAPPGGTPGSLRDTLDRDLVRLPIRFLEAECPTGGCGLIGIEPLGVVALLRLFRRRRVN